MTNAKPENPGRDLATDGDSRPARFARVPAAVFGAGEGLVAGLIGFVVALVFGALVREAIVVGGVLFVVVGIGFTYVVVRIRRYAASERGRRAQRVNASLVAGRVPDDMRPEELLPKLDRSRKYWKSLTIAGLVFYPAMVVLGIVVLVGDGGRDGRMWLVVAVFTGATVLSAWQGRAQLRRIRRVTEQLR